MLFRSIGIGTSFVSLSWWMSRQRKPNSRNPDLSQPRRFLIASTPGSARTRNAKVGRAMAGAVLKLRTDPNALPRISVVNDRAYLANSRRIADPGEMSSQLLERHHHCCSLLVSSVYF